MTEKITCIVCPMGCIIDVDGDKNSEVINSVSGHTCERGKTYAENEFLHPLRILTTTVTVTGGRSRSRLPVRSAAPIPRELVAKCVELLKEVTVEAPVSCGDVILSNVLETGIDVVSSMTLERE